MKSSTFFSRGDYLATKLALVAVAVAYPGLALVPRLLSWAGGQPLTLTGQSAAGPGPVLDEPTPGIEGRYTDQVTWTVADASAGQWLAALAPTLMTALLLVVGAVVLWRLVSTTQRGVPFDRRAVGQLRTLGVLLMAYGLVRPVGEVLVGLAVFWSGSSPSLAYSLDLFDLFPFVVGSLVLVVAECFRVGLRLSDDTTGLV